MGKNSERIISIPFLAQSVMAIGLSEPDNARARPSSLLKRNEDYRRVFSAEILLPVYLWLARTQRRVDSFLSSGYIAVSGSEKTNLRFYVSMVAAGRRFGGRVYNPEQLRSLASEGVTFCDGDLEKAFIDVKAWADTFMTARSWTLDQTAKSKEFATFVLGRAFGSDAG